MVHLILPFVFHEFELVKLSFGLSFGFFIDKSFYSLLGKTIAVMIASFRSCETAFEEKGSLTLLEPLLVVGFPLCELFPCLNLFWCEFSVILNIGHGGEVV